ncbi:MAG: queuosine precursor transporter [Alphaproteobacteria bacterium]
MFYQVIEYLQSLNSWVVFAAQLLFVWSFLLLMLKVFGKEGLYVFVAIAVVIANIEVLKLVNFNLFSNPITLGNILFSSVFLATDILSEVYGKKYAQKAVMLGFFAYLLSVIALFITLGYKPITAQDIPSDMSWALAVQPAMETLFVPSVGIFISSMTAYFLSQFLDITIFHKVKDKTNNKYLWLRNNASTFCSSVIDNTTFNFLAFVVLTSNPVSITVLLKSYILGMLALRWSLAIFDTPIIYFARKIAPKN